MIDFCVTCPKSSGQGQDTNILSIPQILISSCFDLFGWKLPRGHNSTKKTPCLFINTNFEELSHTKGNSEAVFIISSVYVHIFECSIWSQGDGQVCLI